MDVAILVCTYGDDSWERRAREHALPSATPEGRVVVRHVPNGTLAQARNAAARDTLAEWLCFLDADDELAPGYTAAMAAAADTLSGTAVVGGRRTHDLALLAPAVRYVTEQGRTIGRVALPNRHHPIDVMNHCVIGTLVQRALFLAVGGFQEEPAYEDWALWLRCVRAGARVVDVPDAVYVATSRVGSRNVQSPDVLERTYHAIRDEHLAASR